ncbi:hypothetical protein NQ317_006272 [Molorchus minor]|uniref:RNA-directed DNA polymerase n=1 Tax=Molorchus minor TaxID=1323400 RepID=A0ABQ9IVF2_9CUCU|nr:hypothetical protein NQ317_006272 [Molorchus minor]
MSYNDDMAIFSQVKLRKGEFVLTVKVRIIIRNSLIDGTVHQKRSALREAIRDGRVPIFYELDPIVELTTCSQKITNLSDELANFDYLNKDNEKQRISSRLVHLQGRLNRIIETDESQKQTKIHLLSQCSQLFDDLNIKLGVREPHARTEPAVSESLSLSPNALPLLYETVTNDFNTNNLNISGAHAVSTAQSPLRHSLIDLQPVTGTSVTLTTSTINNVVLFSVSDNYVSAAPCISTFAHTQPSFSVRPSTSVIAEPPSCVYTSLPGVPQALPVPNVGNIHSQQASAYRPYNILPTAYGQTYHSTSNLADQVRNFRPLDNQNLETLYPRNHNCTYLNKFDITKWRISFDGHSSVTTFLEDIEEMRISRGLTKQQLFKSAAELFTGSAKSWYRFVTNYISTWDELVSELKASFQYSYYDRDLLDEIKRRSQGADEPVVIYISKMESYFNKLSRKPLEPERVQIIRGLVLPNIQRRLPLCQIYSIRELMEHCRNIEEDEKHVGLFVPPPPATCKSLLEPQLAYCPSSYPILGLLDSGATNTIVGQSGLDILLNLGLRLDMSKKYYCKVANGQSCNTIGMVRTPVCLMGKVQILEILVIPELSHKLILGMDFWLAMNIVPDLKQDVWHFGLDDPHFNACGIQWRIENGLLYKYVRSSTPELSTEADYWKMVVPKDKRKELIKNNHDDVRSGHLGIYKVYWKLRNRYTWPKMHADVAKYVRSCQTCAEQKQERKPPSGLMGSRPQIYQPWQMISLDFIGPLPRSSRGNVHALVISDYFSKYVQIFPLRSANAKSLTKLVEENVFLTYGVPERLICDNGVQMRSKEFRSLCQKYNTKIDFTANYYPRADPCERVNGIIKTMISSYVKDDHRKWDENLSAIACAIRTAKSETTGYSPFYINFGREYVETGDWYKYRINSQNPVEVPENDVNKRNKGFRKLFENVKNNLAKAQERNRRVYNLRRRPVHFSVGDKVWRKNKIKSDALNYIAAKLAPKFIGPFIIKQKTGSWTYELCDSSGQSKGVWHVQDLKHAHDTDPDD